MADTRVAVITGLTGQDGVYLASWLLSRGYSVHGIVHPTEVPADAVPPEIAEGVATTRMDITDTGAMARLVSELRPDEFYNLAAQSSVRLSWQRPLETMRVNGLAVMGILGAIREHSPETRFFQASSSEVFGEPSASPQSEQTPLAPVNPYGLGKAIAQQATSIYRGRFGLFASCGILYNHESPRRGPDFVTRKVARGVAELKRGLRERLTMGDLEARRDWGYAPNYVEAMWRVLQHEEADDFVIATGRTSSVRDLLTLAFARVGIRDWDGLVEMDPALVRHGEGVERRGDISKIKRVLGWEPRVSFEELVALMVDAELARLDAR